jgi:integrase
MELPALLLGRLKGPAPLVRPGPRHTRSDLACTPDLTNLDLDAGQLSRGLILRVLQEQLEAEVKDKTYQLTPIGDQGRRFLDTIDFDRGDDAKNTRESYELPIAWLALDFDYLGGLADFCNPDGIEQLERFFHRHWGECSQATKRQRISACRSFGNWAEQRDLVPYNPFRRVKLPRKQGTTRVAHPVEEMQQMLRQDDLRDECALGLFVCLAFRKNDGRTLQIRDIDLTNDVVYLRHRKGGKALTLPIEYPWLREKLYLHIQGESRQPGEYLIYPKRDRSRPMSAPAFHRWFKRCLERAGLDPFPLHELRHTAGDMMWRKTKNLVLAQQLLGHDSYETTRGYLHPDQDQLREAMRVVAATWESDE